jgi:murein DD-endopeptidase MepM/ murein hydrolase activator NlpD
VYVAQTKTTSSNSVTNDQLIEIPEEPTETTDTTEPAPTTDPSYYYPMKNYKSRITNRGYGKQITADDSEPLACGDPFEGYHTGDDLEVTENELNTDVPVYAIAAGTVRQISGSSGYGGLVVIEHILGDQVATAYYGHIRLSAVTLKEGDKVTPGQQITVLGDNCSTQTSFERKHLHFDIHKGTEIDVRGYAPSSDLDEWIDPSAILESLNASEPI